MSNIFRHPFGTFGAKAFLAFAMVAASVGGAVLRAEDVAATQPESAAAEEAKYTQTLEKRAAEILAQLKITDAAKSAAVHDAVISQYRALRDWQAEHQAKLKELARAKGEDAKAEAEKIMATRAALHGQFFGKLSALLDAEQIETVKDKLTYNKVKVTYNAYCAAYPDLNEEEKAKILGILKEARELAVDGTSAEEKTAIFGKYKGRINNYLGKQGHGSKPKKTDDKAKTDAKIAP